MTNRYDHVNFLVRGKHFDEFWKEYLSDDKQIKYIMGLGFDPRTMNCFTAIRKYIKTENINYKIIEYDGETLLKPQLKQMLEHNTASLANIIPKIEWNSTVINTTNTCKDISLAASKSVQPNELNGYTDIILDINAMPTGVYFPIVRNVLEWISKDKIQSPANKQVNFHMVVSENVKLDDAIKEEKIDDSITYMHKFATKLQSEARQALPKVWIPLLGKDRWRQMDKIRRQVENLVEFCPFFPMPSVDPYRCKKLLIEHRELLIDGLGISSKDYVYSHEMNPFEVCRKIYNVAQLYYHVFKPLGGCKVVISPLSSKLMCVGALLAACELLAEKSEAGIVHVVARGHNVDDIDLTAESQRSIPHSMWLAGECYA